MASRGNLLDVGCGNGGFLRAFRARNPRWRLCGTEFDRRNEKVLKKIPGFVRLYCGKHMPPPGQFDLISLVHVLEHLENPSGYLAGLRQLSRPGAKFVIEVPDAEANPFILPVADHVSHFDRRSLRTIVEKAGLKVEFLRNDLVPRELTLVAKLALRKGVVPRKRPLVPPWLRRNLSELGAFARLARREARRAPLTVFGSSLGAAWIYGVTRGRVKEFLDEDTDRQGRRFLGRPIRLPAWGCGRVVLVPLALKVRSVVTGKLGSLGWKPAGRVKK
jgi:SAM-dependent methyltransferase